MHHPLRRRSARVARAIGAGTVIEADHAPVRTALLECHDVTVAYGSNGARVVALRGVDLALIENETVALWGPSGSGKTTLLHAMGGLVEPTGGVVRWNGAPLSSLDASARARARAEGIAYVFQGSNLLPMFTTYENVAFAAYVSGERDAIEDRALELLGIVGLRSKADSLPSELSGGEAQRVGIARALSQCPRLLLCDEPTGHLDSDTAERVLDMIDRLQSQFGFTLVVATHDADAAARFGRVIELRDGHLVEETD
jgi:ABC-type lipoprotein export system ATPase subunit